MLRGLLERPRLQLPRLLQRLVFAVAALLRVRALLRLRDGPLEKHNDAFPSMEGRMVIKHDFFQGSGRWPLMKRTRT